MSDFHLLYYLFTATPAGIDFKVKCTRVFIQRIFKKHTYSLWFCACVSLSLYLPLLSLQPYLSSLCECICRGDRARADQWRKGDHWPTIEQLIRASSEHSPTMPLPPPPAAANFPGRVVPNGGGASAIPSTSQEWSCQHCTYLNPAHLNECDVCHLPRT